MNFNKCKDCKDADSDCPDVCKEAIALENPRKIVTVEKKHTLADKVCTVDSFISKNSRVIYLPYIKSFIQRVKEEAESLKSKNAFNEGDEGWNAGIDRVLMIMLQQAGDLESGRKK